MGQPPGVTVAAVQERNRTRHDIPDTATFIIADAVAKALRDPEGLRREYRIAQNEWPAVERRLREFQRKIDPYGDWR